MARGLEHRPWPHVTWPHVLIARATAPCRGRRPHLGSRERADGERERTERWGSAVVLVVPASDIARIRPEVAMDVTHSRADVCTSVAPRAGYFMQSIHDGPTMAPALPQHHLRPRAATGTRGPKPQGGSVIPAIATAYGRGGIPLNGRTLYPFVTDEVAWHPARKPSSVLERRVHIDHWHLPGGVNKLWDCWTARLL